MIDSALSMVKEQQVKALIDGTEMEGWELRAAWDDFKPGLKYGNEFVKIAIYGVGDFTIASTRSLRSQYVR